MIGAPPQINARISYRNKKMKYYGYDVTYETNHSPFFFLGVRSHLLKKQNSVHYLGSDDFKIIYVFQKKKASFMLILRYWILHKFKYCNFKDFKDPLVYSIYGYIKNAVFYTHNWNMPRDL